MPKLPVLSAKQVIKALELQVKEDLSEGNHSWIGTILLEQGFITLSQLDEVLQTIEEQSWKTLSREYR